FLPFFFLPSRVGEGVIHEKPLRSVSFLRLMTAKYIHVLAVRGDQLDGWYISVPSVSTGRYPVLLAGLLKVSSEGGQSLALRVLTVPGGGPELIGLD
ncbi:hypothetical protein AVEN_90133-1, partial [Araneus ventricosus]